MTIPTHPRRPSPANPRQIIGNPAAYAHMPEKLRARLFTLAWYAAKSQQGHPVLQTRLQGPCSGNAA